MWPHLPVTGSRTSCATTWRLMRQSSALEYLRHGQTPFFRLPTELGLAESTDAVILGVPHDGGTTYQPGARFAPFHVRRTIGLVQSYHTGHRVDVFSRVSAVDGGNIVFPPFDRAAMRESVFAMIHDLASKHAVPFVVGGDHSITTPILRAVAEAHGSLAVLHIDAHLDTSSAET